MSTTWIFTVLTTAFAWFVLSCGALFAADSPDDRPRRPDAPNGGPNGGPNSPRNFRMGGVQGRGGLPFEMVLDADQRAQFREEMMSQRERQRELDEKTMKLRRELDELMLAEKLEEKAVREKANALAEVETERTLMRARAFAKVRPSLTEEQLKRLRDAREEFGRGPGPVGGGGGEFRRPVDGPRDRFDGPRPPQGPGQNEDVLPPPKPRPPASAPDAR